MTAVRGLDGALAVAGTILVAALMEEIVFRGVLFRVLEGEFGTPVALLLQSLIFGALHVFNTPADTLTVLMTLLAVTLIGALWTCVYVVSRNLWVVGLHHAAWNCAIVATGVPLSGLEDWRAQHPSKACITGRHG